MKIFNNFQTKRQLRRENERLKAILFRKPEIHFVEREVQKISSCMELDEFELDVKIEDIKDEILYNIVKELYPFVEWEIKDINDKYPHRKIIKGNVYIARRF